MGKPKRFRKATNIWRRGNAWTATKAIQRIPKIGKLKLEEYNKIKLVFHLYSKKIGSSFPTTKTNELMRRTISRTINIIQRRNLTNRRDIFEAFIGQLRKELLMEADIKKHKRKK